MIRNLVRSVAFAAVCAACTASAATARTIYDGEWSVLIVTERGICDRAYRYGVQINNGHVLYQGGAPVNFAGRVARSGSVRVSVSAGSQKANGSGRLSRNFGRGTWRGQSPSGTCSGYWEAERR